MTHRLAAEAIIDTTVRLVKRRSLEQAAGIDVQVARKLWTMTAGELPPCGGPHVASGAKERHGTRREFPA